MSQPFFFVYFHFFFFIAIVFVVLLLLLLISLLLIYFSYHFLLFLFSFFLCHLAFFDIFLLFYFDLFFGSTVSSEKIVSLLMYMQLYSFKYWSILSFEFRVTKTKELNWFIVPFGAILTYFGVRVGLENNLRFLLCSLKAFIFYACL